MKPNSLNRRITITIIDSGVNASVSDLYRYIGDTASIDVDPEGYITVKKDLAFRHIHGTVVSLVIRDICPNVTIRSLNILDENLLTDGRILLYAIEHALYQPPDILHMSLGTTSIRYWLALKLLLRKARRNGTIVVAAADNMDKRSYPAFMHTVVGVKTDTALKGKNDFSYRSGFFYAPCTINGIKGSDEIGDPIGGNSTAAAFITGHLAKVLGDEKRPKIINAVNYLRMIQLNNQCPKESRQ